MGIWWREVNKENLILPENQQMVFFAGDSTALSKKWPILWRRHQDWHSLHVSLTDSVPADGYLVFFESESVAMHYRWLVNTPFVMVRVGPVPIKFWVTDKNGQPGTLSDTGVVVLRGSSRGLVVNPNEYHDQLYNKEGETRGHTWI